MAFAPFLALIGQSVPTFEMFKASPVVSQKKQATDEDIVKIREIFGLGGG